MDRLHTREIATSGAALLLGAVVLSGCSGEAPCNQAAELSYPIVLKDSKGKAYEFGVAAYARNDNKAAVVAVDTREVDFLELASDGTYRGNIRIGKDTVEASFDPVKEVLTTHC